MTIIQRRSKRKLTGGRYKSKLPKRNIQTGRAPVLTTIGETKTKTKRTLGGNSKIKLLRTNKVNLLDQKTKKAVVAELKSVDENEANRHWVRRNIISKGAIIQTSKGKAKVTNRPGQDGFINATLI